MFQNAGEFLAINRTVTEQKLRSASLSLSAAAIIFVASICPLFAEAGAATSNFDGTAWRPLRIGAGGFLSGLDISADGATRVVRTDTYGAYIWDDKSAQWKQLVTVGSMPNFDVKIDNSAGVYEIRVAPNLSDRLYMAYLGYVYRSDNRGARWIRTNFKNVAMNANDEFKARGQKIAVDPANADVAFVGTSQDGLRLTTDGGASWQSVSSVPASAKDGNGQYPGISGIEFDASLGITNGKTNTIFAASYGNGVYESTDGGGSWFAIGGPTDVQYAAVSKMGIYYVVGDSGKSLWRFTKSKWTKLLSNSSIEAVALDPFNADHIALAASGGQLNESLDAGATWTGPSYNPILVSTDIPWLANTGYMSIGGLAFDPLVQNKLWTSDGVGVWNTNVSWVAPGSPVYVTWNDQSVGIEQLVANQVIAPPGGRPVVASWDRPFFYVADSETYPSQHGPINGSFSMGWALDYASSSPRFVVGISDWWGKEESGFSTDGGRTWAKFASYPPINGKIGGGIAASTPANIVWAPSNQSSPYYTKDGGRIWKQIAINGTPANSDGWGFAYYTNRHIVAADRVTTGTFYIYNSLKGLYRSTDGGENWILIRSGEIAPWSGVTASLKSVPDHAGHLFFTSGPQSGNFHPADNSFMHSTDGGVRWTTVSNVHEVRAFGFGAPLSDYPTIFIVGWVGRKYGIWRSDDHAQSWIQIGDFPTGSLDGIKTIDGNKDVYGTVYIGFGGSGYAYGSLQK